MRLLKIFFPLSIVAVVYGKPGVIEEQIFPSDESVAHSYVASNRAHHSEEASNVPFGMQDGGHKSLSELGEDSALGKLPAATHSVTPTKPSPSDRDARPSAQPPVQETNPSPVVPSVKPPSPAIDAIQIFNSCKDLTCFFGFHRFLLI